MKSFLEFWKCLAWRACFRRWRSTALFSILLEIYERPKSMRKIFDFPVVGVRMMLEVVRSEWIMLFAWSFAVCLPNFCIVKSCLDSG